MDHQGLLNTQEGWNELVSQYVKQRNIADIDFVLNKMMLSGFAADLGTYKIILNGLVSIDTREAYMMAAYHYWRRFIVNYPAMKPDRAMINQMILCCKKLKHLDRAFYFVSVLHQCNIQPNIYTIKLLLAVSLNVCNNRF